MFLRESWAVFFKKRTIQNSGTATFDGLLLKYIKQYDTSSRIEMVLRALRAFWLTEAHQNLGSHKRPQELKRIAQMMVRILEDQADAIRATFGIERMVAAQTPISLSYEWFHASRARARGGRNQSHHLEGSSYRHG